MANMTPLKAIRAKCTQCKGRSKSLMCEDESCPLHPFKDGRNPNIKPRQLTPEQRQAVAERLQKARENRG